MSHFLLLGHFKAIFNHFVLFFFHFLNQQMVKFNMKKEKCALYLKNTRKYALDGVNMTIKAIFIIFFKFLPKFFPPKILHVPVWMLEFAIKYIKM